MAKSTCSSSSSSSYSSSYSSTQSSASSTKSSPTGSSTHLGFKSVTDRRKRLAANARERKRMHLLNQAYDRLRKRLVDAENKSKYDVLVQAKEYIQALAAICESMDRKEPTTQLPINNDISLSNSLTTFHPASTISPESPEDVASIPHHGTSTPISSTTITPQLSQFGPSHHYPQTMARLNQTMDYV